MPVLLEPRGAGRTDRPQIDRHLAAVDAAIGKGLAEDGGTGPPDRDPDLDPGRVEHHRGGPAHPDARTRPPRRQGGRQPGGSRAGHAPVRRLAGPQLHPGRPAAVRRLLYMPALAAIRCNPGLRAKYRQLRGLGKPPKVALTAVMRKLLLLANALLEQNRSWLPDRPGRGSAAAPAGSAPFVAA